MGFEYGFVILACLFSSSTFLGAAACESVFLMRSFKSARLRAVVLCFTFSVVSILPAFVLSPHFMQHIVGMDQKSQWMLVQLVSIAAGIGAFLKWIALHEVDWK